VIPPKATLTEQWRLVQELLDEAELRRVEKLTPEQIEAEAKTSGIDEARARALLQRAIDAADAEGPVKQAPTGNVVPLSAARKRRSPVFTLTTLAIAAGVAAVFYVERKPIGDQWQAWFHPTGPVPTEQPSPPLVPPKNPEESPLEKARRLREEAYVDVAKGYLDDASDELDEAQVLDPAGDDDARVKKARDDIQGGPLKRVLDAKTGVETWEKPLPKRKPIQH
jgi:hypothetical protein